MLYFNLSTLLVIFVIFLMQGMKSNSAVNPMVVQPPGVSLHAAPSFSYNIPQSGAIFSSNQQHAQSSTVSPVLLL